MSDVIFDTNTYDGKNVQIVRAGQYSLEYVVDGKPLRDWETLSVYDWDCICRKLVMALEDGDHEHKYTFKGVLSIGEEWDQVISKWFGRCKCGKTKVFEHVDKSFNESFAYLTKVKNDDRGMEKWVS